LAVSLTIQKIDHEVIIMDRRRQQRVVVDLPVRIWGLDAHSRPFTQPASLRTISGRGATLQGVDAQLKPGDLVDLQYGEAQAQFRVVWLGKRGTEMQGEVGIESLSTDSQLWDVDPMRCAGAGGQG
jgi:hypothetical protein